MKRIGLLALPVLALVAVAGIAAAYPAMSAKDMTDEEKSLRVQMLEQRQEMIQEQIAYLNGEITQEQLQERLQTHLDETEPLREQLREMATDGEGCACGFGNRMGHRGFGPGMMGGF
jgi:TolA-binding protein